LIFLTTVAPLFPGVATAGIVDEVRKALKPHNLDPIIFADCGANPSYKDIAKISKTFIDNQ
jgi:alcohol dehydrogenase class IV